MWDLTPGQHIRRVELHDRYGGSRQGGISYSAKTPNVFCFTEAKRGNPHGYYDEWAPDDTFLYTGEGQAGDQTMTPGNRAIYNQVSDRRALRLFEGASGIVTYVGEFVLENTSYLRRPGTDGRERSVIMFHLRRVSEPL